MNIERTKRRGRLAIVAVGAALLGLPSCDVARPATGERADDSVVRPGIEHSSRAAAILADLRRWSALIRPSRARFRRTSAGLHAQYQVATSSGSRARVRLPLNASQPFRLRDECSGLVVSVRLRGATAAPAALADGHVVYPDAFGPGGHLVHRVHQQGTEDYLRFEEEPAERRVSYQLALGHSVAALRLVANVLELLDADGIPRLRMAPPFVLDASQRRWSATTRLTNCAFDDSPSAPWRRPVAKLPPEQRQRGCTVEIAWPAAARYPLVLDPLWTTTGSLIFPRAFHSATVLLNGDVLVAYGGWGEKVAELYHPSSGNWAATGIAQHTRLRHTATLLDSGKVLVVGGLVEQTLPAELYDPALGTWSQVAGPADARYEHAAVKLQDGRVLVVGDQKKLSSCELFDPVTEQWSPTGDLVAGRWLVRATLLPSGKVLMTGGVGGVNFAETYDPLSGSWTLDGYTLNRSNTNPVRTVPYWVCAGQPVRVRRLW